MGAPLPSDQQVRSRGEAMLAASEAVRNLAAQSQKEALAMLEGATDLDGLLAWGLSTDSADGPGAQPFLVVLNVLKWLLGPRLELIKSGAHLREQLQQWHSSTISAEVAGQIERYIDEHSREFCEGEHLGGPSENAIFLWVDASVSLVTI